MVFVLAFFIENFWGKLCRNGGKVIDVSCFMMSERDGMIVERGCLGWGEVEG